MKYSLKYIFYGFVLLPLFSGCTENKVEKAGKIWCDCVNINRDQGKSDNEIWEICHDEMFKYEDFDFFHLFHGGTGFSDLSVTKFDSLMEEHDKWNDYRYNNCRLKVDNWDSIE